MKHEGSMYSSFIPIHHYASLSSSLLHHSTRQRERAEIYAPIQLAAILWRATAACWPSVRPSVRPLAPLGRSPRPLASLLSLRLHLIMSKAPLLCSAAAERPFCFPQYT